MTKKVLFVDDEQSLLNGIDRRLGLEFELELAISGPEALEKMQKDGPFAVVVTDMQMPEMNGVQFIQNARKFAPDTTYLMLTGNQDIATATQAVNDGKVFRFMNKPCETEDIKRAVEVGLRQYQLVTGEKELLHKTFSGAVGLLTEVLEISHPEIFSQVPMIEQIFDKLREASEVEAHWEYKLAARFGLLGLALLTEEERTRFQSLKPYEREANELLEKAASVAGRLVDKIPRLHSVAEIVMHQKDIDGNTGVISDKHRVVRLGATFLRIAIKWNLLANVGIRGEAALAELRKELPNITPAIEDTLLEIEASQDEVAIEVAIADLKEGMVLARDIMNAEGAILLRKGRLLSPTTIEKLHICESENKGIRPIQIVESSCPPQEALAC